MEFVGPTQLACGHGRAAAQRGLALLWPQPCKQHGGCMGNAGGVLWLAVCLCMCV